MSREAQPVEEQEQKDIKEPWKSYFRFKSALKGLNQPPLSWSSCVFYTQLNTSFSFLKTKLFLMGFENLPASKGLSKVQKKYYSELLDFLITLTEKLVKNNGILTKEEFNKIYQEKFPLYLQDEYIKGLNNITAKLIATIAIGIAVGVILGSAGAFLTWYIGGVGVFAGTALGAVIANTIAVKLGVSAVLMGIIHSKIGVAATSGGIIAALFSFFETPISVLSATLRHNTKIEKVIIANNNTPNEIKNISAFFQKLPQERQDNQYLPKSELTGTFSV